MAEPVGIFIDLSMEAKDVNRLLNQRYENAQFGNKLGYFFSELLYKCHQDPSNVFIFNYNPKTQRCYIAWLINYFSEDEFEPFNKVLEIIGTVKKTTTTDYALVATTFPDVLSAYQLTDSHIQEVRPSDVPQSIVAQITKTFWSFSSNNDFPEPEKALKKRNYLYKNFKNYYKRYLAFVEETERPEKIAQATRNKPYHLYDSFYSYDKKVFEFRTYNNQIIELPQADPLTLRSVAGINADKNYVYAIRLAPDSPPNDGGVRNNPDAKWVWYIVEGIDGASFQYVKEKWDTVYWKDKHAVYFHTSKIENADSDSFEYLDFCFGKDKNHVFFKNTIIPINVTNFTLNKNGFIYDCEHIYHYENKLPLDAKTFEVLKYASEVNPFLGTFVLADKNDTYEYNGDWDHKLNKRQFMLRKCKATTSN